MPGDHGKGDTLAAADAVASAIPGAGTGLAKRRPDAAAGRPATPDERAGDLPRWQSVLADAIRDPAELLRLLRLPAPTAPAAMAQTAFPLLVTRGFAALMRPGDRDDPLLLQVLPSAAEEVDHPGYLDDPLAERGCMPSAGVLHKYPGRALLVCTGACAIHCRYCFRRHFPYGDLPRGRRWYDAAVAYLAADPSLHEVLLSGGDPLMLPDGQLSELAQELAAIPHLQRLRVHSRLPVVLPERVDAGLLSWLTGTRLRPVLVIHCNHAQELGQAARAACQRLTAAGVTVLNQSVLLAGVNDDADRLAALSEALFACGVLPYYLHMLDRVRGAGHFHVPDARALHLVEHLRDRLPGYLVPRLVREIPGASAKLPVA
jgi:EF-P beta-lysylation protein EpmB